ncbi:hypothetical protein BC830DRAFT_1147390 [Chytriomyces sp. MP71]|nr:hypothetical protein BC830DRAFT_1147390 [Chytriomyces sp. MP71]
MSTDGYIYLSSTLEVPESQKERAFSHSNKAGPRCKAGSSVSSRKNSLNHLPRDRQPSGSVREVVNESEIKKLRKVLLKLETVIQESENVYSRETSTCMQILQRETATFRDVAKKLHAIIPDTNDATSKLTIDHEVLKAETETLIRSVESIHQVTVPQQGPSTPCPSGIATKLSSIQSKLQTVIQDCQKIICESKPYQISQESAKLFEVSRKLQIVTQERDELRKIIAEYQEMISDCQRDIQNEILEPEGERLDHLLYRGNHTDVQTQTENRVPSEMSDKEAIACIKRGSWLIKTTRAGRKHLRFVMVDSFKMEVSWYPQTIKGVLPHLKTVSLISFDIINSTSIMIRTPKRSIYLETEVQGQLAVWIQGLNALFERLKTVDGSTNTLNANSQSKIGKSRHILSDVVERSKKRTQE